jgi:translation elongation factor EF-Ts
LLKKDDILKLGYLNESNKTIGDQVALSIGSLGENMALRRAVIFTVQPGQTIGWYMHGTSEW